MEDIDTGTSAGFVGSLLEILANSVIHSMALVLLPEGRFIIGAALCFSMVCMFIAHKHARKKALARKHRRSAARRNSHPVGPHHSNTGTHTRHHIHQT